MQGTVTTTHRDWTWRLVGAALAVLACLAGIRLAGWYADAAASLSRRLAVAYDAWQRYEGAVQLLADARDGAVFEGAGVPYDSSEGQAAIAALGDTLRDIAGARDDAAGSRAVVDDGLAEIRGPHPRPRMVQTAPQSLTFEQVDVQPWRVDAPDGALRSGFGELAVGGAGERAFYWTGADRLKVLPTGVTNYAGPDDAGVFRLVQDTLRAEGSRRWPLRHTVEFQAGDAPVAVTEIRDGQVLAYELPPYSQHTIEGIVGRTRSAFPVADIRYGENTRQVATQATYHTTARYTGLEHEFVTFEQTGLAPGQDGYEQYLQTLAGLRDVHVAVDARIARTETTRINVEWPLGVVFWEAYENGSHVEYGATLARILDAIDFGDLAGSVARAFRSLSFKSEQQRRIRDSYRYAPYWIHRLRQEGYALPRVVSLGYAPEADDGRDKPPVPPEIIPFIVESHNRDMAEAMAAYLAWFYDTVSFAGDSLCSPPDGMSNDHVELRATCTAGGELFVTFTVPEVASGLPAGDPRADAARAEFLCALEGRLAAVVVPQRLAGVQVRVAVAPAASMPVLDAAGR